MTNIETITTEDVARIVCSAGNDQARGVSDAGVWLDVESGNLIEGVLHDPGQIRSGRVIPLIHPLAWDGWALLLAEDGSAETAFADADAAAAELLGDLPEELERTIAEWREQYAEARRAVSSDKKRCGRRSAA